MLVEIYLLFQILVFILFFVAFFTRQELIWAVVLVLSGVLVFSANYIETYTYSYNETLGAYVPLMEVHQYTYLSGINLLFFGLATILMLYDIFSKYGNKLKSGEEG